MKKKYRIIVDSEKHRDIYEQLESIPRALRGEFIRIAIRLLMNNTTPMNNLRIEPAGESSNAPRKSFSDVFG